MRASALLRRLSSASNTAVAFGMAAAPRQRALRTLDSFLQIRKQIGNHRGAVNINVQIPMLCRPRHAVSNFAKLFVTSLGNHITERWRFSFSPSTIPASIHTFSDRFPMSPTTPFGVLIVL